MKLDGSFRFLQRFECRNHTFFIFLVHIFSSYLRHHNCRYARDSARSNKTYTNQLVDFRSDRRPSGQLNL